MQKLTIEYADLTKVKRICAERGMKDGDNSSFWDWCEQSDVEVSIFVGPADIDHFNKAVTKARSLIGVDVWAAPRIVHHVWHGDTKTGFWERAAFWEIEEAGSPDISKPDCIL